jgi:hypothetical protein
MGIGEMKRPLRSNAMPPSNDFSHEMVDDEPDLEYPEYSHEVKRPYKPQRQIEVSSFGYERPTEQTSYDGPSGNRGYTDSGA